MGWRDETEEGAQTGSVRGIQPALAGSEDGGSERTS